MAQYETTITREIPVTVEYSYYRGYRGNRYEPDEDASVEIQTVRDDSGKEIELTDSELAELEEACLNEAETAIDEAKIEREERDARD